LRWDHFPVVFLSHGTQPGAPNGGVTALQAGLAAWTNDPNSNVVLQYGGTTTISSGGIVNGARDGVNTVQFNDPSNEIPGSFSSVGGATLAITAFRGSGSTHVAFGEQFFSMGEVDIVVQDGITGAGLTGNGFIHTLTHELGHALGFRHSDQTEDGAPCGPPLSCSSNAIMNSSVNFNADTMGSTLQAWDMEAIAAVYGSGAVPPPCNPPAITTQPQSVNTISTPVSLTVAATGDAPLQYQWFIGSRGNVTQPIQGAVSSGITVQPAVTTNYWVRVSNNCGTPADSNTATVTVNGCPAVTINSLSSNTLIVQGKSTTLSVDASGGTGLTFRWFIGPPGSTSNPAGTGSSISVRPDFTTAYWVRVTNNCGGFADSDAVVVTVQPCSAPAVVIQPSGGDVLMGSNAVLFVGDSGTKPESYQWFEGEKGDTSKPVLNANQASFTTPLLIDSVAYWVRVTNDCGTIDSQSARLIVVPTCQKAVITSQPQDQTVAGGTSAMIRLSATGTSLVYQWYNGPVLDFSRPVGGSAPVLLTNAITAPTQFWVRVSSPCGSADSVAVTISPMLSVRRRPSR
jgi:hypothetical protein